MPAPPGWYPKRGEVYLVQLDKPRPAIVLSVDPLNKFAPDVCVVGTSEEHGQFSMRVPIKEEHGKFSMRVPIKKGDAYIHFTCSAKCDQLSPLEKALLKYPPL